jgi:hypothetical protein
MNLLIFEVFLSCTGSSMMFLLLFATGGAGRAGGSLKTRFLRSGIEKQLLKH